VRYGSVGSGGVRPVWCGTVGSGGVRFGEAGEVDYGVIILTIRPAPLPRAVDSGWESGAIQLGSTAPYPCCFLFAPAGFSKLKHEWQKHHPDYAASQDARASSGTIRAHCAAASDVDGKQIRIEARANSEATTQHGHDCAMRSCNSSDLNQCRQA